jgi:molybdopterin-guanine dinucleotide biosynthesis protein A
MAVEADRGRPVVVAVLAGGRATRFGAPKAAIELHGRPLVSYPLRAAHAAALEAVVVAKRASRLPPLDEPVVHEPDAPHHPLCGIVAALRHAHAAVLAVGCDMPFVSPGLLACLAREGAGGEDAPAAVAAEVEGVVQPLPALYGAATLPALERALTSERSLRGTLQELDVRVLGEGRMRALGDPRRLFFSVNDRAALETAALLLVSTGRRAG